MSGRDSSIAGVGIDLDGTLIDSIGPSRRAYFSFLHEFGASPCEEEFKTLIGPPLRTVVSMLISAHGLRGTLDELHAQLRTLIDKEYRLHPLARAGAAQFLRDAKDMRIPVVLVTSADMEFAEGILARLGFESLITAGIVGGNSVSRGKPAPDPYLKAAEILGVSPHKMVAIEDSPTGVAAAFHAGMACYALLGTFPELELRDAGAVRVVHRFETLRALLRQSVSRQVQLLPAHAIEICSGTSSKMSVASSARVERFWEVSCRHNSSLRDNLVFAATSCTEQSGVCKIAVSETPYRFCYSERRGISTGTFGVAVSGIVRLEAPHGPSRYVLGRRGMRMAQSPGAWEFIPSGAMGVVSPGQGRDPRDQLLQELQEEIVCDQVKVQDVVALGVVKDVQHKVLDLCYCVNIHCERPDTIVPRGSEYDQILLVDSEELNEILVPGVSMVPTVLPLFSWVQEYERER